MTRRLLPVAAATSAASVAVALLARPLLTHRTRGSAEPAAAMHRVTSTAVAPPAAVAVAAQVVRQLPCPTSTAACGDVQILRAAGSCSSPTGCRVSIIAARALDGRLLPMAVTVAVTDVPTGRWVATELRS